MARTILTHVLRKQVRFSGTVCKFGQARKVAECAFDVTASIPKTIHPKFESWNDIEACVARSRAELPQDGSVQGLLQFRGLRQRRRVLCLDRVTQGSVQLC